MHEGIPPVWVLTAAALTAPTTAARVIRELKNCMVASDGRGFEEPMALDVEIDFELKIKDGRKRRNNLESESGGEVEFIKL